jgi:hypothetical protein
MTEITEMFCPNCNEDTPQIVTYDTHERDSSNDHFIYQVCEWEYFGITGKYEPPEVL